MNIVCDVVSARNSKPPLAVHIMILTNLTLEGVVSSLQNVLTRMALAKSSFFFFFFFRFNYFHME